MFQNGRKLQTIDFSLLAYSLGWWWGGGENCPVLIAFKDFILWMISYYGRLDILTEIKFWMFHFIFVGIAWVLQIKSLSPHHCLHPPGSWEAHKDLFPQDGHLPFPSLFQSSLLLPSGVPSQYAIIWGHENFIWGHDSTP